MKGSPLSVVADPGSSRDRSNRLRVIHDPLGNVPALTAEELDHLTGREPVHNTALVGQAARAAGGLREHGENSAGRSLPSWGELLAGARSTGFDMIDRPLRCHPSMAASIFR